MKPMNIYLSGVGGQGIGLLSGALSAAVVQVGYRLRGCETHGLAQRGGVVISHLRLGDAALTPRVPPGEADLVVALERLEALRATRGMLKQGGAVFYYDANFQPIHVRMGQAPYPSFTELEHATKLRCAILERVHIEALPDPRMQNVALLGRLAKINAIGSVDATVLLTALREAIPQKVYDANKTVFETSVNLP